MSGVPGSSPDPGRAGRCGRGVRPTRAGAGVEAPDPSAAPGAARVAFASGLRRFRAPDLRPRCDTRLTGVGRHAVLPIVTDTYVRLWRRVHMDLVRYAGCVCRPSC
ncbi:putative leader peptide [Streptomyces achromogenes]|uniref:putative leader peptide n=1 Tax=Streptomyces achromogenes TaxID=67255 RepID=UPI0036FF6C2A